MRQARSKRTRGKLSQRRLDELIEEATVDAYGEAEQKTAFLTMIADNLAVPFQTEVLGVGVTVERVDFNDADEIVAICRRGRDRRRVPILDLPLPSPKPTGWEWIEAYRYWACRG